MGKIIDFDVYPVRITLPILLQDKTTKQNIIWDTDAYDEKNGFLDKERINIMIVRELFLFTTNLFEV